MFKYVGMFWEECNRQLEIKLRNGNGYRKWIQYVALVIPEKNVSKSKSTINILKKNKKKKKQRSTHCSEARIIFESMGSTGNSAIFRPN